MTGVTTANRSLLGALIVAGVGFAVVLLLAGAGYLVLGGGAPVGRSAPSSAAPPADSASAVSAEDALAAAPMPTVPAGASLPHTLVASTLPTLLLPAPMGRRGIVSTGFPRTPQGAVAQLGAIDSAALAGMNPAQVSGVYRDWAMPGAEPIQLWSVDEFVTQTLAASGIPDGSSQLQATFTVSEAQIKGILHGGDFVLACINGELDIWLGEASTRTGAADCARMVWADNRWQIGSGSQPAVPPSVWPGTAEAGQVGWRPIRHVS